MEIKTVREQINNLACRLDELNRITKLGANRISETRFEQQLKEKAFPSVGKNRIMTCVKCLRRLKNNSDDHKCTDSCVCKENLPQCLSSSERIPTSPLRLTMTPDSCEIARGYHLPVEQSKEPKDYQFNIEENVKLPIMWNCEKEHDIDDHVKVLASEDRRALNPDVFDSCSVLEILKKSKNNSALQEPVSNKKVKFDLPDQSDSQTSSVDAPLNSPRDECVWNINRQNIRKASEKECLCIEKSEFLDIKEEISTLRSQLEREVDDVRNFVLDTRSEMKKIQRPFSADILGQNDEKENRLDGRLSKKSVKDDTDISSLPTNLTITPTIAFRKLHETVTDRQKSFLTQVEPIKLAHDVLREVECRRNDLDQTITKLERSRKVHDAISILDMLGKNNYLNERARINALVDDAIAATPSYVKPKTAPKRSQIPNSFPAQRRRGGPPLKQQNTKPDILLGLNSAAPRKVTLLDLLSSPEKTVRYPAISDINEIKRARELETSIISLPQEPRFSSQSTEAAKAVRFHDRVLSSASAVSREASTNTEGLNKCRNLGARRSIKPLGMRQYSMLPIEGRKTKSNDPSEKSPVKAVSVSSEDRTRMGSSIQGQPDFRSNLVPLNSHNATASDFFHQRQMEDDLTSRLLRHLAEAVTSVQDQRPPSVVPTMTVTDIRRLVEAALTENLSHRRDVSSKAVQNESLPETQLSICKSSDLTEINEEDNTITESNSILATPESSIRPRVSFRERASSAKPLSVNSPPPAVSRISRAVSAQSLLKQSSTAMKPISHAPSSPTLLNLDSLSVDSEMEKTPRKTTSHHKSINLQFKEDKTTMTRMEKDEISEGNQGISLTKTTTNDALDHLTNLSSPEKSATKSISRLSESSSSSKNINSLTIQNEFSGASESSSSLADPCDWSLSAPHSFSDGLWLNERSEGEAVGCPLKGYEAISLRNRLGPLPTEDSTGNNSTSSRSQGDPGCGDQASFSSLSSGEIVVNRMGKQSGTWIAPWRDPLLHLIALNAAGKNSQLPWNRRADVQKIATVIRKKKINFPNKQNKNPITDSSIEHGWIDELVDCPIAQPIVRMESSSCHSRGEVDLEMSLNQAKQRPSIGEFRMPIPGFNTNNCPDINVSSRTLPSQSELSSSRTLNFAQVGEKNNCNCAEHISSDISRHSFLSSAKPFSDEEEEEEKKIGEQLSNRSGDLILTHSSYTTQWESCSKKDEVGEFCFGSENINVGYDLRQTISVSSSLFDDPENVSQTNNDLEG